MRSQASLLLSFSLLLSCSVEKPANELVNAASPYLREHADNPVHWVEWSDKALQRAAAENKPIIVSIGYASCHWCHVMERESFMDTAVARVMNRDFVCIKVDREERPDLDQVYIRAAEMISGNAGWPLNAFALPDGRPFYAGTYFPRDQWMSLLDQVSKTYRNDFANIEKQAVAIQQNIVNEENLLVTDNKEDTSRMATFIRSVPAWVVNLDMVNGGLLGPNRFPMPVIGEFFLQHYNFTGDPTYLKWVTTTLDEMACGGIYDQLGGGFARYTVDEEWRVPHFEKMLYDNGQLVSLYAHAYQATGRPLYLAVLTETLAFIADELTSKEGGFFSSINADSEGEEGKFYVWTKDEIKQVLGADSTSFITMYDVTEEGNWVDGKNILRVSPGQQLDLTTRASLAAARKKLLGSRNQRTRPARDEKILTSWNAMMLNGYIDAFKATGNRSYLESALRNASYLQDNLTETSGDVHHAARVDGEPTPGFLEDYAWTAKAFINLYEATFDLHWLTSAQSITDQAKQKFQHEHSSLFYFSSEDVPNPVARKVERFDNVIPSSNSVFAEVLLGLSEYYQDSSYETATRNMISAGLSDDLTAGIYLSNWARLAEIVKRSPFEVAVVGPNAVEEVNQLQRNYLPFALYLGGTTENLPLLENKLVEGKTIFYVCRNRVCKQPTEDSREALAQLRR